MFRKMLAAVGIASALAPAAHAQITPRPEVLTGAFTHGFVGEADEERYTVRTVRIGEVQISSGRVILVDPFMMSPRDRPLTVSVPPGRYPVDLAVADAGDSGQRVALARCEATRGDPHDRVAATRRWKCPRRTPRCGRTYHR